jgi:hypothetical protein
MAASAAFAMAVRCVAFFPDVDMCKKKKKKGTERKDGDRCTI